MIPEVRFARSEGVDIAYQVFGRPGPPDLVFLPGWVSHLEVMWELSEFAAFLQRLGSFARVIAFDKRGTGLSDRVAGMPTLEERAGDVGAVMDAAGSRRAALAAWGDGAPIAAMFAATHPERVSAIVLGNLGFRLGPGAGFRPDLDVIQAAAEAVESAWGHGTFGATLAPSLAGDPRFQAWYRRWERNAATPNAAAATLRWAAEFDLDPLLPAIQAPTLVVERSATEVFDPEVARAVAAGIAGGTFVEVPGADALPFVGDTEPMLGEIQAFLTGARGTPHLERALVTLLFTDIVGSTQRAGTLGDRRWRYLLDAHRAGVRRLLDRYGGTEVDTAGDGFLATFAGPARGIQCSRAIRDEVRQLDLEIRAGLHTGEVERQGDGVAGMAVHVGARVAALAEAGEVLVTNTVKALVLGSGIAFADRGLHTLKGVPDEWQLFAVEP